MVKKQSAIKILISKMWKMIILSTFEIVNMSQMLNVLGNEL